MTDSIATAGRHCINSLGIPVDDLTLQSAVDRIAAMARRRDGRARLVSTLNVDFLVNSLGTALTRPRHPELLEVLRGSDLVTADGFPIVWLSRLLGRPLAGRVCGSDLVPALAERAVHEGLSLFLFGGGEGVAAAAALRLQERYPGLKIAGTAAPMVHTTGNALGGTAEEDAALLRQIHASDADILLVGLGNPKQELWFNRTRSQLRVPVSIGVGGSFEFITGTVRRAPAAWQRLNLEWLYRITQDPKRLWKRYAVGLGKLALLAAPVAAARLGEKLTLRRPSPVPARGLPWRRLWSSRDQAIRLLRLPADLGPAYLQAVSRDLLATGAGDELQILDFSAVRRIRLAAQAEFFTLAELRSSQGLQLLGLNSRVRRQLTAARLMDLVDGESSSAIATLAGDAAGGDDFNCQSYSLGAATLVMLSGRVNRDGLAAIGFVECLLHSVRDRPCILDLRGVTLLESSGIAELLPLLQRPGDGTTEVLISGATYRVRQMLRVADIAVTARIIDDAALIEAIAEDRQHGV